MYPACCRTPTNSLFFLFYDPDKERRVIKEKDEGKREEEGLLLSRVDSSAVTAHTGESENVSEIPSTKHRKKSAKKKANKDGLDGDKAAERSSSDTGPEAEIPSLFISSVFSQDLGVF